MLVAAGYVGRVGQHGGSGYGFGTPAFSTHLTGGSLPVGSTFTRASSATYFDSTGARQTATSDVPRFDYNPFTLEARGLLIEKAATNYLLNSTAPVTQTTASLAVGTYVLWVEGSGSAATTAGTATGSGFGTALANAPNVFTISVAGTVTVTITGTITAFQLEDGSYPTSLIITAGATGTRAVESCSMTIGSWYNPDAGTWTFEGEVSPDNTNGFVVAAENGAGAGANRFHFNAHRASKGFFLAKGNVTLLNYTSSGAQLIGSTTRCAFSYDVAGGAVSIDGSVVGTTTSALDGFSSISRLAFGHRYFPNSMNQSSQHIRRIAYYATRANDAQLNSLSLPTYMGLVATKGRMPDAISTGNKQYNSRSHHIARDDISSLRLLFPNWYYNRSGSKLEAGSGGTATISASVEYPAGVFKQVLFAGNASVSVADGANGVGDVNIFIPNGATFWVREFRSATVGIVFLGSTIQDAGDFNNGERLEYAASGLTDKTLGGTIADTSGSSPRNQAAPIALIGLTNKASVLIVGNSKARGAVDAFDGAGDQGEIARSIGPTLAYTCCGSYGNTLATFNSAGGHERQLALAQYASHIVSEYGINDLTGGAGSVVAMNRLQTFWGSFPGKKVSHCTITPVTSSTDLWMTSGNQTPGTTSSRTNLNDALRALPAPLWAIHEVADVVETARNSTVWKSDGVTPRLWTADGTHESQYGFQQIAASGAINAALFVR